MTGGQGGGMKHKVGDRVWVARCDWVPVTKPCPVCFGEKAVTLILGNGDHIQLDCDYCGRGYELPTGTVQEYEYVVAPECMTITNIEAQTNSEGTTYEYKSSYLCPQPDKIFLTKEEAEAKGLELKAELEKEQETRVEYIKKNFHKTFSWNAGYHRREAKRLRKTAEWHERKAQLCKARAKEQHPA